MDEPAALSRVERIEAEIDSRLVNLWSEIFEDPKRFRGAAEDDLGVLGAILRVAYATGYQDALREDAQGEREKLCRDYGYRSC